MRDAGGPGIVGFELAGTERRAHEILADWGGKGHDAARLSLWIDYLYLLAYGAFFAVAVRATRDLARERGWRALGRPGDWIAAVPLAAAGFDALEDAGLLLALGRHGGAAAPAFAAACAYAKFVLSTAAVLYVLAGLIARLAGRRQSPA
jgi:hypothetical protein